MASNSRELAQRPAVDPRDEPSAEWGWHGSFPIGSKVAGVFTIISLVAMFFVGHEDDWTLAAWVFGTAGFIAIGLAVEAARRRHAWRR